MKNPGNKATGSSSDGSSRPKHKPKKPVNQSAAQRVISNGKEKIGHIYGCYNRPDAIVQREVPVRNGYRLMELVEKDGIAVLVPVEGKHPDDVVKSNAVQIVEGKSYVLLPIVERRVNPMTTLCRYVDYVEDVNCHGCTVSKDSAYIQIYRDRREAEKNEARLRLS